MVELASLRVRQFHAQCRIQPVIRYLIMLSRKLYIHGIEERVTNVAFNVENSLLKLESYSAAAYQNGVTQSSNHVYVLTL